LGERAKKKKKKKKDQKKKKKKKKKIKKRKNKKKKKKRKKKEKKKKKGKKKNKAGGGQLAFRRRRERSWPRGRKAKGDQGTTNVVRTLGHCGGKGANAGVLHHVKDGLLGGLPPKERTTTVKCLKRGCGRYQKDQQHKGERKKSRTRQGKNVRLPAGIGWLIHQGSKFVRGLD